MNNTYIFNFLKKYLFIYKAIADGWRVKCLSNKKFAFYNNINRAKLLHPIDFLEKYNSSIKELIT